MNRTPTQAYFYYKSIRGTIAKAPKPETVRTRYNHNWGMESFIAYCHVGTITVNFTDENFFFNGTGTWQDRDKTFSWAPDSSLLTVVAKDLSMIKQFENNQGKFGGLTFIDYSTKKVYRLVMNGTLVTAMQVFEQQLLRLPWFVGSVLLDESLVWN